MRKGWKIYPFEDCLESVPKTTKIPSADYKKEGAFPIVSQEELLVSGYWDDEQALLSITHPVIVFGDHTRVLKYIDFDFVIGADGVKVLSPKVFLSPKFLFYYLKWSNVPSLGYSRHYKLLKEMSVPVPPLAEQERIVAELDLLQGIIDKQKAQLKELDTLAQSIFYDMFQHEHGQVVKLHDVCSIVSGLVNPNEEPYCNYPHIGGANIESGTGVFINVKLAKEENLISGKYLFDETMILYSKIRPNLNKVALPSFVGICSADMYPIIPDRDRIDRTFLKFVLSQPDFLEYAISHSGRANIPKINREDLMDYSFMSYSLSLQQSFATKIEAIERQKASINASIAETQKLFNYTMDKYFG